jgi:hypothetical protein
MDKIQISDLESLSHKDIVRFALFCAYQVQDKWITDIQAVKAIRTVELWLEDKATLKQCDQAADNTDNRIAYATGYSVASVDRNDDESAGNAWHVSDNVFRYTTRKTHNERLKEQWDYLIELRDFNKITEQILLGG